MIQQNNKYKIALIGYRLGGGGGDRVMANLSIFFEQKGIEVHNIIVLDVVTYAYSGKLLNLGKYKNGSNTIFNKAKRLFILKKYLLDNNFDYIIDFRFRVKPIQELIIARWIYNTKTIFNVNSYLINNYLPNNSVLTRLMYSKSYAIVCETKITKKLIEESHKLNNVIQIFNPINIEDIAVKFQEEVEIDYEYIIAAGQIETNVKQFDKLIDAYSSSILPKNNIHLVILGEGERKQLLQKLAIEKNIDDKVHFLGFQTNPFKFMKKAKFFVLSSKNEGFANVLAESLACQTPVVSFNCLAGPSDIITEKENGLLVENQNTEKLTEAMNLFVEDQILYNYCKQNTLQSVQSFSISTIGQQWLDLMGIRL